MIYISFIPSFLCAIYCSKNGQSNCICGFYSTSPKCQSNSNELCYISTATCYTSCPFNTLLTSQCLCSSQNIICNIGFICSSNKGCLCGNKFCNKNYCIDDLCLSSCPNNDLIQETNCVCGENICNQEQMCSDGACLSSCPNNDLVLNTTCLCGENVCFQGQICIDSACFSFCENNNVVQETKCLCGENVCMHGQMCIDGACFSFCPNNDIAPEIGCICGVNRNVCNE